MAAKSRPRQWSPLTCLTSASLSPSGLIVLESDDGEVETLLRTNVELRYHGSGALPLPKLTASGAAVPWNARDVGLSCHVTTHRIVLLDEKWAMAGSIPFPLVQTAHPVGGPSFRSPKGSYKIELSTHAWGELTIVFRGGENKSYSQSSKDRDDALNAIHKALNRKAWKDKERQALKEALRPSRAIALSKVGVDAILTQNELRHRENATLAELAFGGTNERVGKSMSVSRKDNASKEGAIDAFLREATELTRVIQKYSATIDRERAASSSIDRHRNAQAGEDTEKLVNMMENMGMTSALSEKQSGSVYHKQLARQIVDFLRHNDKLTKAGGMMTLTDVYCLFNRARGTNMISPEDLLKSLDLMKDLNLGLSKRSFKSGVLVIQDDSFDDEVMAKKLANLASSANPGIHNESTGIATESLAGGITVMAVCRALKTSALLANEQLLSAEQMGWLCRDSTIEGVRFFPNLFKTFDCAGCEVIQ